MRAAEHGSIPELSIVALRHSHDCESGVLPKGALGTIVYAYSDGAVYEVEFDEPLHCVVTVERDDIRQV
jgi:hypothetical protein